MLRRRIFGKRPDEFLLDAFIVCFAIGNLFHPLAPAAAATFAAAAVLCVDFSGFHSRRPPYGAAKGHRPLPGSFGRRM